MTGAGIIGFNYNRLRPGLAVVSAIEVEAPAWHGAGMGEAWWRRCRSRGVAHHPIRPGLLRQPGIAASCHHDPSPGDQLPRPFCGYLLLGRLRCFTSQHQKPICVTQVNSLTRSEQMAVYAYVRVSTIRQASEGESLETQQRIIAGYAQMHDLKVDQVFLERAVSGSTPLGYRPQGKALLAALRPGDSIIIAKLDRMFRSALDALGVLGDLKRQDISLHMIDLGGDVTGNGVSKLVFTILSAVAEAERDRTRERIAEVKRDQRGRGRFLGGSAPFGWRVGDAGELVEVPEQQKAIRAMVKLRKAGKSLRAIAETMRGQGHSISHVTVAEIIAATEARIKKRAA